jgi:methanogenic corrinoid protein MtbC1
LPVQYPIRAASKLTGLPIDTLRAWERRYRAVVPERVEGERSYSEAEIRRLILLRNAVECGHAIRRAVTLSDAQLSEIARSPFAVRTPSPSSLEDQGNPQRLLRCLAAVEDFDYAAANEELSRLAILAPPRELVLEIILPLMRIAGHRWEIGAFQVSQEHLLSASVRNLLGGLIRIQTAAADSLRLLFTTLAGEMHEFGVLAAAMLAAAADVRVTYLGPNLPAREIVSAAAQSSPHVVVLGAVMNETPAAALEISQIAEQLSPDTELWLGGAAAAELAQASGCAGRLRVLASFEEFEANIVRLRADRSSASHAQ